MNKYLPQLYRQLYNEGFDCSNPEHCSKLQCGVYLLMEFGVPVGDYDFHLI